MDIFKLCLLCFGVCALQSTAALSETAEPDDQSRFLFNVFFLC